MPLSRNRDLHGAAPDKCPAALLLIDWINDLEFEGGEKLFAQTLAAAKAVAALRRRAEEDADNRHALEHMAKACKADTGASSGIDFAALRKAA